MLFGANGLKVSSDLLILTALFKTLHAWPNVSFHVRRLFVHSLCVHLDQYGEVFVLHLLGDEGKVATDH